MKNSTTARLARHSSGRCTPPLVSRSSNFGSVAPNKAQPSRIIAERLLKSTDPLYVGGCGLFRDKLDKHALRLHTNSRLTKSHRFFWREVQQNGQDHRD